MNACGGCGRRRWLETRDLERTSADGYFWLTGRIMIRRSYNIERVRGTSPAFGKRMRIEVAWSDADRVRRAHVRELAVSVRHGSS
jgi:hypothetical protein